MQYIVYNASKDVRLPGEFEYRDALFSRSSLGRILRMLLDTEWSGDRIAILPTDKWDEDRKTLEKAGIRNDPVKSPEQSIIFATTDARIPLYVFHEGEPVTYVEHDCGSVYNVDAKEHIDRFDTLIPLISIDPPSHLMETYYADINGKWVFEPLFTQNVKPDGEDLTQKYDIENFYRNYSDPVIYHNIRDVDIPETGLWVGDLIGLIEEE